MTEITTRYQENISIEGWPNTLVVIQRTCDILGDIQDLIAVSNHHNSEILCITLWLSAEMATRPLMKIPTQLP